MEITGIQIGWGMLCVFQIAVAAHFISLYRIDGDKRKIMFGFAFLIGVISVIFKAFDFTIDQSTPVFLINIYYWSFIPIIIALFSASHHILFNLKNFRLFFYSFVFFVVFSFFFLLFYPTPASDTFSLVLIAAGIEIIIVSIILFIRKRDVANFIFLMAVIIFTIAGMITAQGLEPYFQIFAFFMGYIFILLIFSYPTSSIENKSMSSVFTLQKQLDKTKKTLQITSERYRDLFEHIKSGVAVYDAVNNGKDFVFKDVNSAVEQIEHISKNQLIGKRVTDVFPNVKDFGLLDVFTDVWETGVPQRHPVSFYKDGRLEGWRENMVYKLSSGELVSVYDDVTEEKQKELDLQKAHEDLKRINEELDVKVEQRTKQVQHLLKQKDEFINQLGHDLKNPLGPFIQLLPILKKHMTSEKDRDMIEVLDRNARYMKNLVKKTIELAKLNSEKTKFNFEHIALNKILEEVLSANSMLFDTYNVTIENRISPDIEVDADIIYIQEVFTNLFTNAVKYSKESITITIDAKELKEHVLVSVQDTGLGISSNQIEYLFDEYFKADSSRHDFESSGLGLPICKRIIEKHGGKIWAESTGVGEGSIFYFTLLIHQHPEHDASEDNKEEEIDIYKKIDMLLS